MEPAAGHPGPPAEEEVSTICPLGVKGIVQKARSHGRTVEESRRPCPQRLLGERPAPDPTRQAAAERRSPPRGIADPGARRPHPALRDRKHTSPPAHSRTRKETAGKGALP
jgi:hypothetical protein